MKNMAIRYRTIDKIFAVNEKTIGTGLRSRTVVGGNQVRSLDPVLLLDHISLLPPGGFPDHPHRGIDTVTYLLKGCFIHEDFCGNKGELLSGDLQWMTAGKGMLHCETPGPEGAEAIQLWINLAKDYKMMPAAYQNLCKSAIVVGRAEGVAVRVLAGEALGVKSPIRSTTPLTYLDITIQPKTTFVQPVVESWNVMMYVLSGAVWTTDKTGLQEITANHSVMYHQDGVAVHLENRNQVPARMIFLSGKPLAEPMVRQGPFVMNTQQEIREAIRDFTNDENGFENATEWKSEYVRGLHREYGE